jgi:uncharacterized protein (DUF4415 family)
MKKESKTDWKRINAMKDKDIDTTDIPFVDFSKAKLKMPETKELISLRVDSDILVWFKNQGKGYQTKINAILRTYMDTMKEKRV